jgi:hypothetical protein
VARKPAERDAFVSAQLSEYIERAKRGEGPAADRYKSERRVLERLIPIKTSGFRGITLTAIMGKLVRDDINTGTEFDAITPRPLFEKGIKPVLKLHRIPTGASAPLNVAKNAQVLDEKWAEGRRPEDAARAAVEYIRLINRHWPDPDFRDDLIMMFIQRLVKYAEEVAADDVELAPIEGLIPIVLAKKLSSFSLKNLEGGALPQFVVGVLLATARVSDGDYAALEGVDASVFGTNTTSNKPADLWEKLASGEFGNLYEVTCKPVDLDRLDAAVESFAKLAIPTTPITFVCRMPEDCGDLDLADGSMTHRGLPFQFLDIRSVIETTFVMLTAAKRVLVMEQVAEFVADPNRLAKTKKAWAAAFGA